MSTKTLAALFCSAFAISIFVPSAQGQNLSGSSLDISGTATIGTLVSGTASTSQLASGSAVFDVLNITGSANFQNGLSVSGTTDIIGNTMLFGAWTGDASTPGVIITYGDGANGVGASFTMQTTRPGVTWNWMGTANSGSAVNVMQLDASNRLILTGTATSNPPQLLLDPNGSISVNGNSLITQNAADARYFLATAGLSSSNGNIGIGTDTPLAKLDIRGSSGGIAPASLASFYGAGGTGDLASKVTIQSNSNSYGQIQIGGSGKEVSLAYISGVTSFGVPPTSNLGTAGVVNQGLGLYTDTGDTYSIASDAAGGPIFRIKSNGYGSIGGAVDTAYKWTVYGNERVTGTSVVNGKLGIGTTAPKSSLDVSGNLAIGSYSGAAAAPANSLIVSGSVGIGTNSPSVSLDVSGDIKASGSVVEKIVKFTPTSIGWYRIVQSNAFGGGSSGGVVRIYADTYDGTRTDVEFQYNISGFGYGGAIQQTRFCSFNNGCIGAIRVSSNNSMIVMLDIYVRTATSPKPITIYGYGRALEGFISSPVVGAVDGGYDVHTLVLGHGFRSTEGAVFAATSGNVGIGTDSPSAKLDVNGSAKIAGNVAISGTGSLTLPDGTVLSSSSTLARLITDGTASTISGNVSASHVTGLAAVATTGNYSSLSGLPTIPIDNSQLANSSGYITSSGTVAHAATTDTAAALSGTISALQVNGLAPVATGGILDYSRVTNVPTNVSAFTNDAGYVMSSGTASNLALAGTTKISGGIVVTGTAVTVTSGTTTTTKIVSSGTSQMVLIPEQGDISMGSFTNGAIPQ